MAQDVVHFVDRAQHAAALPERGQPARASNPRLAGLLLFVGVDQLVDPALQPSR